MQIRLSECIGKAFYEAYHAVMDHAYTHFNFTGGRGSLKSSFISIVIVLLVMYIPNIHGVVYRKVADTIETSVYAQICWAIDKLGVSHLGHPTKSPYRVTYLPTGQTIYFKGLDKAEKSKSIKVPFGYIAVCWFEELDEYAGEAELRKVIQSIVRGGDLFGVFKSMNPPRSKANWANSYIEKEKIREDTYTSKTTYLQAPEEWLGEQFIAEAEHLKSVDPKAYSHEYMGEIIGMGTEVFDNLDISEITDEQIKTFDHIYMGIDGGGYPDPFRGGKMHYDANRRELWFFDELNCNKTSNQEVADRLIKEKGVEQWIDVITCDSAEKKSTADLRTFGIDARNAEKGPNSIKEGLKWLQSLRCIHIDPIRCPKTAEEFRKAEYETNRQGEVLNTMPDRDNHSIDLTRYAMERVGKRRGN